MGVDDIEGGCQPDPGSCWFGRVKGLEDVVQRLLIHPNPVIDHLEANIVARRRCVDEQAAALEHSDIAGADRNVTWQRRNGIGGIEQEVHDHLLELRIIAQHLIEVAGQVEVHLSLGREPGVEQINRLQDHLVHIEQSGFDPPALHIGEQLVRELSHTASGTYGSIQVAPRRTIHGQLVESNGGVSQDDRQQIIKIMNNTADLDTTLLYLLLFYKQREGSCIVSW